MKSNKKQNFLNKKLYNSYIELFRFLYFSPSKIKYFLNLPLNIKQTIIILGAIGVTRNMLEVYIGGRWANQWFTLTPDVFFTMFFYPIFLCFYSTMLIHFISQKIKVSIDIKKILSLMFFIQIVHLFIPFFDGLAEIYNIPYNINISDSFYIKLLFTPIAFTPLILLFTHPTSLGIDIAWLFTTVISLKLFIKYFKLPITKTLIILLGTFYIIYLSIYPIYYFFINENIIGTNYMFGIFFLSLSIPSIIYVDIIKKY